MTKKKLVLVDIVSLSRDKKLYGHGPSVARSYYNALRNEFDVILAGSYLYKIEFPENKVIVLPFSIKEKDNRFIFLIKGMINVLYTFSFKSNIIIFQNQFLSPLYYTLSFFKPKNKKIFTIQYQNPLNSQRPNERHFFKKVIHNIDGIISSLNFKKSLPNVRFFQLPDYFPVVDKSEKVNLNKSIDILSIGTVNNSKDLEMVAKFSKNSSLKIVIAGKFFDKKRKYNLEILSNNKIEFIDEYISNDRFKTLIRNSKFVILPYKANHYNSISSGIVYEALYNFSPVIVPDLDSFNFIKQFKLGVVYKSTLLELSSEIFTSPDIYRLNINRFILRERLKLNSFIGFLNV
jgi:hypothetical protein